MKQHMTYFIDVLFLDIGILEDLFHGLHGLTEKIHVELFKLGPSESFREIIAILERLDFNPCGLLAGQCALRLLDLALQLAHGAQVGGDVSAGLLLVQLDKVVNNPVVKIFTSEVSVTSGCENFEDTVVDGKERYIKSTTTKVVDDDLRFSALLVETIGDGGGGRLVDDTEDLKTGNSTSILGCLTLSVIEV